MFHDPSSDSDTGCFGCRHEFLLTERQDLASYQTSCTGPSQEAQDKHQVHHSGHGRNVVSVHCSTKDDEQRHRRDAVEDIYQSHDETVNPAAEVTCDTAHDNSDNGFDSYSYETDDKGDTSAVHKTCQHVHTVSVSTQPVFLGRS